MFPVWTGSVIAVGLEKQMIDDVLRPSIVEAMCIHQLPS